MISVNSYYFKGKEYENLDKIQSVVDSIDSIYKSIIVGDYNNPANNKIIPWSKIVDNNINKIHYEQLPFNHPLYIMFSSGNPSRRDLILKFITSG